MIHNISETALGENQLQGVAFKELRTFPDDRGFFREVIRGTDSFFASGFAQWSHSKMGENTVKAWHFHHRQSDWWYCGIGVIHTALFDLREESPTYRRKIEFLLGDPELNSEALTAVVHIPPGVAHGCKVLSAPAHLFYITSRIYDPQDEGRYPFDTDVIPHFWGNSGEVVTSEKDRCLFMPAYERERLR